MAAFHLGEPVPGLWCCACPLADTGTLSGFTAVLLLPGLVKMSAVEKSVLNSKAGEVRNRMNRVRCDCGSSMKMEI